MLPRIVKHLAGSLLCGAAYFGGAHWASAQFYPPLPAAPLSQPDETKTAPQDDLKARVDRLEKQNVDLLKALQNIQSAPTASFGNPISAEEGGGVSKEDVTKIVAGYLKDQDAKKKTADAAKAKEFHEVGSDLAIKTTWKDGLNFETANKDFKFHVGGRAHYDMGWFGVSEADRKALPVYNDAAGFRRARLRADGTCWEVINWVTEFDFATPDSTAASATFTDVYMDITQLPIIGTFRVGHFKEWFSLEELTSSRYLNTLERSTLNNAFTPARHLGIGFTRTYGNDENGTISGGWFRTNGTGNRGFDSGDSEYSTTGRLTFLPVWADNGRRLVHVGGAASYRGFNNTDNPDPSFSSRMELRLGTPTLLSTGSSGLFATSESVSLYGGEAAMVWGPFTMQSEIIAAQVNNDAKPPKGGISPSPLYWGTYVQASYFLTGEHRPYSRKSGAFDRVKPHENFFAVRDEHGGLNFGRGAWELVARYSYLDLNSDGFVNKTADDRSGGTGVLTDVTLGVNWYLNPNFKWQVNYVRAWRHSDTAARSGAVDGVGMRFAWDF